MIAIKLLLFISTGALGFEPSADLPADCGRAQMVRCETEITKDVDSSPTRARPGDWICAGAAIETRARARIRWLLKNGIAIEALPDSRATLETSLRLRLRRGSAFIERPLATPEAAAFEVKMTDGSSWISGAKASVETDDAGRIRRAVAFKGTVEVAFASGRSVRLGSGEALGGSGAKRALTSREARDVELDLRGRPPKKNPSPPYACESE